MKFSTLSKKTWEVFWKKMKFHMNNLKSQIEAQINN
jgi:hypothetical protein